MLQALSQSESNKQKGLSRRPFRIRYANFFHDVLLGFFRVFFIILGSCLNTLRLFKHGTRIKRWLLVYEVGDVILSHDYQFLDHSNSQLLNSRIIIVEIAERRE